MHPPRLFAIDHNFPERLVDAVVSAVPGVTLVPVRKINGGLHKLADWEIFAALHNDAQPWDGLITNDADMLSLAKEMCVLSQTGLTLVVARGQGDNPARAVGVLLCHLAHICHHTKPGVAQIWHLSVKQKSAESAAQWLETIVEREKTSIEALVSKHRIDLKPSAG